MTEKNKKKLVEYKKLMKDISALKDEDREKVSIYVQGIMVVRKIRKTA